MARPLSTETTLLGIWDDFKEARKSKDLDRMRLCLREHKVEYDPNNLGFCGPQREMARRRIIEKSIEYHGITKKRDAMGGGSW